MFIGDSIFWDKQNENKYIWFGGVILMNWIHYRSKFQYTTWCYRPPTVVWEQNCWYNKSWQLSGQRYWRLGTLIMKCIGADTTVRPSRLSSGNYEFSSWFVRYSMSHPLTAYSQRFLATRRLSPASRLAHLSLLPFQWHLGRLAGNHLLQIVRDIYVKIRFHVNNWEAGQLIFDYH